MALDAPLDEPEQTEIWDVFFVATESANKWFLEDKARRNAILIFCSALLDIVILFSNYVLIFAGPSGRYPLAFAAFYGFRFLL